MKGLKQILRVTVLLMAIIGLSSWGFLVHKTVHQLAVYQLPKEMSPFFYGSIDKLVYDAVRPDVRRNTDSTEASKHFIDLEPYGQKAAYKMPLDWEAAIAKHSKDSLLKYGYVPYHITYMKGKLTQAFRNKNKDSILFYAADLGHYIADAHVPLHTTVNYDGQLTNQKGLHSLWESMIPELEIEGYNLYSKHKVRYLKQPAQAIWKAVRKAHALVPTMLANEIAVSKNFTDAQKFRVQMRRGKEYKSYTTEFAKAYAATLKPTINEQLICSADLIADFWYTSWIDAGKPDLNSMVTWTEELQTKFDKELESNKENNLIKDNLLQAKKPNSSIAE